MPKVTAAALKPLVGRRVVVTTETGMGKRAYGSAGSFALDGVLKGVVTLKDVKYGSKVNIPLASIVNVTAFAAG